jgi:uncharacterized protein YndB with AHSA1/START domain
VELHERVERRVEVRREPGEVWDALFDDDFLGEWLGGDVEMERFPRGRVRFVSHDGRVRVGEVHEVDPGRRLGWRWWEEGDDEGETDTLVEIELERSPSGTLVTVIETLQPAWRWELIEQTWIEPPLGPPVALAGSWR